MIKEGETMSSERKGSIIERDKKLYARVQFTDESGRKRDIWRKAESRTHAKELIRELLRELESNGTPALDASKLTVADLCDYYETHYLTEAHYTNGIKDSGLRSLKTPKYQAKIVRAFFGRKKLRDLSYEHLRAYKKERLAIEKRGGGTLSITSVNRELALVRKMLSVACAARWITRNPFHDGDSLISAAAERKRTVILSRNDEYRLLAACAGKRKNLRAFIICAVDSGCRKGELLSARWQDLNLERRELFLPMMNTKTARARIVPLSNRMVVELERLWDASNKISESLIFGVKDVKRAFDSARKQAGLPSVRIHDLRHTFASRLAQRNMPIAELARTLGHQTVELSFRYKKY
jgi:integrase